MPIRVFIDFASGNNFEMSSELFERYERYYMEHAPGHRYNQSSIFSQWLETLTAEEREEINVKGPKG